MTPSRRERRAPPEKAGAPGVRLQKLLADAGVASRRRAEDLIREGRVSVNGRIVRELGTRADPRDKLRVDGKPVGRPRRRLYYLVHKPRGYVTTTRDPHAKHTVMDLVHSRARLFPVGRLDAASEGLLLLTNDGAIAQILQHPSFEVPRSYRVSVEGRVRADALRKLSRGISLDGGRYAAQAVRLLEQGEERSVLELELHEGRRHQIRRMLEAIGHPVRRLVRTRFGPLRLGRLPPGEARPLTKEEQRALEALIRSEQATGSPRANTPTVKPNRKP